MQNIRIGIWYSIPYLVPVIVTVSVGYASCTDPREQIIDVKKRADEVLYQDKKVQNAGVIE